MLTRYGDFTRARALFTWRKPNAKARPVTILFDRKLVATRPSYARRHALPGTVLSSGSRPSTFSAPVPIAHLQSEFFDADSNSGVRKPRILARPQRTIQEVMFKEALAALPVIATLDDLSQLRFRLAETLPQNAEATRTRYADSMIRWFFRDGLQGLALTTWRNYGDLALQYSIHRYLYLSIEPIVAQCVVHVLSKLNDGVVVPEDYLAAHTEKLVGHPLVELTRKRLLSNLRKLGFLEHGANGDRLTSVAVNKTGLLLALHYEIAPEEVRTVSFATIAATPFWRYFGVRTEDELRDFLREADHLGLLGKYVVADRLEQVTTAHTLAELFQRKVRM